MEQFIDLFLHLDHHLTTVVSEYGLYVYGILFLIVFLETGLVVMPLLPGDSLLFAAGTIAARGDMNVWLLMAILLIAAIIGDTVNYWCGSHFGKRVHAMNSRFIRRDHLEATERFYAKHGGKSIILARFVPIIRTFAPFVAGAGKMPYSSFLSYNVIGAVLWVGLLVPAGYFFGNIPIVAENFSAVILGIIFVSILPGIVAWIRSRLAVQP